MQGVYKLPRIIIVGCGFGGLTLAKELSRQKVEVILIDKHNYHTFQPLLYQVASGGLEADNIVYPVRRIFRRMPGVYFRMAEVHSVNESRNTVSTSMGELSYDYLVLAAGSETNYFGFEPVRDKLQSLKSLTDALNLRNQIMQNLERSLVIKNSAKQEAKVNVAIIGGGPAGVEMAGAVAEMKKYVLPKDFPELDLSLMHIYLFEGSSRILPQMSEAASRKARRYLDHLGIIIKTSTIAKSFDGTHLILENGESYSSTTVIWTAGIKPVQIKGINLADYNAGKRLPVDSCNRIAESSNIFAIGDMAACVSENHPRGLPMLAPVAIQQARHLSKNFKRILDGKPLIPFAYKDKGVMATVGRKRAVVDLPNWKFQGLFAWWVWMFLHLVSLIGFRNKLRTLIDWSGSYFTYDKPLGIILPKFRKN